MKQSILTLIICVIVLASCKKDVSYKWNEAPHNAFTDLIYFDNLYYCTFREASGHDSYDGKIRVITSEDGVEWKDFASFGIRNKDSRDPHFFLDDNNILTISTNVRSRNNDKQNVLYKLTDGGFREYSPVYVDNDYWLWSFTKFHNKLYSIGYNTKQFCCSNENSKKDKVLFYQNINADCTNFNPNKIDDVSSGFNCTTEASIIFTKDSTLISILRDENDDWGSHIGTSKYPFTTWKWQKFPYYVRGPKLSLLPDGKIFLCAASMIEYHKTYYATIDPNNFKVLKINELPSGGDTGYPGVVVEDTTALISYYSSHEGTTKIYTQRVKF